MWEVDVMHSLMVCAGSGDRFTMKGVAVIIFFEVISNFGMATVPLNSLR